MNALIIATEIVEKLILIGLFALSIWSLSIIFDRRKFFKAEASEQYYESLRKDIEGKQSDLFRSKLEEQNSFLANSVKAILTNSSTPQNVDRALSSFLKAERMRLEKGLSVLATLGANAPFIGLFGTVLGIIRSFAYLGSQSGSSAVMSGVSQALYATAMGLFVAIPAVIAYNIFSKKIRDLINWSESLRDLFIAKNLSR